MKWQSLKFGDSISGLLVDGIPGTPFVGATLRLSRDNGITVEVPFLNDPEAEQFRSAQQWFDNRTPPSSMYLLTPGGTVSLFEIKWNGHSDVWGGARTSVGTLRPGVAVFGNRDGSVSEPLVMSELRSRIDGLNWWSGLNSVITEQETNDQGKVQKVSMTLRADSGISWKQGDATVSIRSSWLHAPRRDGYDHSTTVTDYAFLETKFSTASRSFEDHFVEQRKVANLLVFLFGRPISFREHKLRDDSFTSRRNDGKIYAHPLTEVISDRTIRERTREVPSQKELGRPLASMSQIGPAGFTAWSENYEKWERFILPSISVMNQTSQYIENIVTATSMSLEAAGSIIGKRPGEETTYSRGRATTATYVYRCLEVLNIKWPERVQNLVGLARAIANNYNDVKHYDRGDFPNRAETYAVQEISRLIVRFLALFITEQGDKLLEPYRNAENLYRLNEILEGLDVRIAEDGSWGGK